jgi:hypothetical protein
VRWRDCSSSFSADGTDLQARPRGPEPDQPSTCQIKPTANPPLLAADFFDSLGQQETFLLLRMAPQGLRPITPVAQPKKNTLNSTSRPSFARHWATKRQSPKLRV